MTRIPRSACSTFAAFAVALALGCKGGGNTPDVAPPVTGNLEVAGTAGLGIIQQGQVTGYEWKGGSWVQEGAATTDASGQYHVTLSDYSGGSVKVTVAAGPSAQMVWNGPTGGGHSFGTPEPMATGLALATILAPQTGPSVAQVPVTPYTTMAEALVEAGGVRSGAAIDAAFARISGLVGFDVARTAVKDLTRATVMAGATEAEQRAALCNAALATVRGRTLADVVQSLAQSAADGKLGSADAFGIRNLLQAWRDSLADSAIAANLSALAVVDAQLQTVLVDKAAQSGNLNLAAPASSSLAPLDAAKKLVSDARSLANNIAATDFTTPEQALGVDLNGATTVINRDTAAMVQALELGVKQAVTAVGTAESLRTAMTSGPATYPVTVTDQGRTLGTLTLTASNPSAVQIHLAGTLAGVGPDARSLAVDVTLATTLDLAAFNLTPGALGTPQTAFQAQIQASLDDGAVQLGITQGTLALEADAAALSTGGLLLKSFDMTDLTLRLAAAGAVFTGQGSIEFVGMKSGAAQDSLDAFNALGLREVLGLKKILLNGGFTVNGKTVTTELGFYLNDADTFDLWSYLGSRNTVDYTLYDPLSPSQCEAIRAALGAQVAGTGWSLDYGYTSATSTYATCGRSLSTTFYPDPAPLLAVYDPKSVVLQQPGIKSGDTVRNASVFISYDGYSYWSDLHGTVEHANPETSSSFAKMTFYANFELTSIPGIPASKVSLVVNRNALTGGTAAFAIRWGADQYTFSFTDMDLATRSGSLTISNNQGVSLQLKNVNTDLLTGELYVGTTKVADVKTVSGGIKITYSDGTFETLQ